jgi:hypothetical protein
MVPIKSRIFTCPLHLPHARSAWRARDSYGGISVGLVGGTPIGSGAGAGPGPLGGISGGTLGGGTSGGVLGGDGLGGCGPGGCWLTASPRGFVGMKPRSRG